MRNVGISMNYYKIVWGGGGIVCMLCHMNTCH